MRAVVQRVSQATVRIAGQIQGSIGNGLLILVGVETEDNEKVSSWLAKKISNLRIFGDDKGKMNLSIKDVSGEALIISQFTLHADVRKGNRPSYNRAARPDTAIPLYEHFIGEFETELDK